MLDPWFVTGFCNGEAAFTYSRTGNKNINLYFSIKLRFDERILLEELVNFFKVGKIYDVKGILPGKFSGNTAPSFMYRVSKVDELKRIVDHFDKYPVFGKKLKAYSIWREMYVEKLLFRKTNFNLLDELAKKLSNLTTKNTLLKNKIKYGKGNSNL